MNYASSLKRTSMSLDTDTLETLARLAVKWNTSKSEVIRRSIRYARDRDAQESAKSSPADALRWLQANGITKEHATRMREEIKAEREARKPWWE